MIRAVGFDLDDTLYEHAQYVRGAYWDVASLAEKLAGVPRHQFFDRIYTNWQRMSSRCNRIFADALASYAVFSPELEQQLVEAYRAHKPTLSPFPGILQGLRALKEAGFRLGLVTDGQPHVQRRKLEAIGAEIMFDAEVYTGRLGPVFYKPHESGFLELIDALGVTPEEAAYVGDNPTMDFAAAKRVGMQTVRVLTGEYRHVQLNGPWIDRTFADASQAISWLLASSEMG